MKINKIIENQYFQGREAQALKLIDFLNKMLIGEAIPERSCIS